MTPYYCVVLLPSWILSVNDKIQRSNFLSLTGFIWWFIIITSLTLTNKKELWRAVQSENHLQAEEEGSYSRQNTGWLLQGYWPLGNGRGLSGRLPTSADQEIPVDWFIIITFQVKLGHREVNELVQDPMASGGRVWPPGTSLYLCVFIIHGLGGQWK